jgi:hypothetical protein
MPDQTKSKKQPGKNKNSTGSSTALLWVFIVAMIGVIVFALYQQTQTRASLSFIGGDEAVVVLLRTTEQGSYILRNDSSQVVQITNLQAMLAGEILHVDVVESHLIKGDQSMRLIQGNLPAGEVFDVQPGETFTVQLSMLGQTLGHNYVYGFRVAYEDQRGSRTEEVIDEFSYVVVVE